MIIVKNADRLADILDSHRQNDQLIGFVPTMGALHTGHLELVKNSASKSDITIASIFVNPTQFNDRADYEKYPKNVATDIDLLSRTTADILFLPEAQEVYPQGTNSLEHYDLGFLETILEGKFRPGHFQGVAQVMSRLLKVVDADFLFMGLKDYQQCMIVQKVIDLLALKVKLIACDTVREPDGLAKSSRNLRLSPYLRAIAPLIYKAMLEVKAKLTNASIAQLRQKAIEYLSSNGFRVDYVEIVRSNDLHTPEAWDGKTSLTVLVAAFLGEVRLIDNLKLS